MEDKIKDFMKARSLITASKKDKDFTLSLKIDKNSSSTIVRNIYECFRMLGEAILISKGIKSENHAEPLKEIKNLDLKTKRSLEVIETLKNMRHNINYRGFIPSIEDANFSLGILKDLYDVIYRKIEISLK